MTSLAKTLTAILITAIAVTTLLISTPADAYVVMKITTMVDLKDASDEAMQTSVTKATEDVLKILDLNSFKPAVIGIVNLEVLGGSLMVDFIIADAEGAASFLSPDNNPKEKKQPETPDGYQTPPGTDI